MLRVGISFVVEHVNMDTKKEKEVYIINGYEYTREDLDYLEKLVGNCNYP